MDIPHTTWLAVLCGCCSPTQDVGLLWSLRVSLALLLLLWEEERDTGKGRVNPLGIFIGLEGEAGKVMLKLNQMDGSCPLCPGWAVGYPAHSKIRVSPLEGKCMINFAVGSHPGWGSPILCSHVSIPQCKTNATHWSSSKHVPSVHGHALGLLPNSSLVTFLILPVCKAPGMNPRVAGARSCSLPLQKAVHSLPCLIAFL